MFASIRLTLIFSACCFVFVSTSNVDAQNYGNDTRREYVRSSSPTKSGGRVISESVGGQKMVRIARAPGNSAPNRTDANRTDFGREAEANREAIANRNRNNDGKYPYPEPSEEQVTAFRQAANQPPQLNFPQVNRLAQCTCNGIPVPAQQLQFPPQNFQQQTAFQQPAFQQQAFQPQGGFAQNGFGFQGQGNGYPLQSGIGVPQFNQTGGNWWTPFVTGSGYYTPLLNFRNMPQGTYLGQGLIGQPTAYVDGQPFRNLLRYISP